PESTISSTKASCSRVRLMLRVGIPEQPITMTNFANSDATSYLQHDGLVTYKQLGAFQWRGASVDAVDADTQRRLRQRRRMRRDERTDAAERHAVLQRRQAGEQRIHPHAGQLPG